MHTYLKYADDTALIDYLKSDNSSMKGFERETQGFIQPVLGKNTVEKKTVEETGGASELGKDGNLSMKGSRNDNIAFSVDGEKISLRAASAKLWEAIHY